MATTIRKNRGVTTTWIVRLALIIAFLATLRLSYIAVMILILANIGRNQTAMIPLATAELRSSNHFVRQVAAQALGTIGPKAVSSVPDLLATLRDDSPSVAADSACALGTILAANANTANPADQEVVTALIQALDHSDGEVRRYAAYAISLIGPTAQAATPKLTQLLSDPYMAYMAARALGEMGSAAQNSIRPMTALLSDPQWDVRLEALLALEHLAPLPAETISAIRECLKDSDERVRDAAKKALAQSGADH